MRKTMTYSAAAIGVIGLAAASLAAWVHASGLPRYPVEPVEVRLEATPARVARGRDLVSMLCVSCHMNPTTRTLSGKRLLDNPPEFGVVYAANITRHVDRGIGRWTDGDLLRLLRTGVRPDGRYTPPYMPKLPRAADEDLAAVVVFLRSDDPLVAPTDVVTPTSQESFLTRILARTAWAPLPYPRVPILAPGASDAVARGRYLANDLLDCYGCHSADFKTVDPLQPDRSAGFYQGGNRLLDAEGHEIHSANLTPDRETGIGAWSDGDFVRALTGGLRPDGSTIRYPMLPYAALSDEDARAIHAYLRTLAPVAKARPAAPAPAAAQAASEGERIYLARGCVACHGRQGNGVYDLRRAVVKYPTDEALAAFIRAPRQAVPDIAMPAFDGLISDDEMVHLVAHVRRLQLPQEAMH